MQCYCDNHGSIEVICHPYVVILAIFFFRYCFLHHEYYILSLFNCLLQFSLWNLWILLYCVDMFVWDQKLFVFFHLVHQQMQLESLVNTEGPNEEVCELVEHIWREALGELQEILSVPIKSIKNEQVWKSTDSILTVF